MSNHINITKSFWVVFNPTSLDFQNANETLQTAQKDLLGIRFLLSKKKESLSYNFEGTGNYTDSVIQNIEAIFMLPKQLSILVDSPPFHEANLTELQECNSNYLPNEYLFKKHFLGVLQFMLIQNNAEKTNIELAYTALELTLKSIKNLDYQNAFIYLNSSQTAGSFTINIKENLISLLTQHLKKYPR